MNKQLYGVIAISRNEKRLPINPELLLKIPRDIRNKLIFETSYGEFFEVSDEKIASLTAGVSSRQEIYLIVRDLLSYLINQILSSMEFHKI
ncbi:hypothetical protein AS144_01970 [Francisella endosymbiont of Amblyomma maculatum]|nr:hypothetical protein AS144_01970 [Francisella endosymbiont of Amblyomma maculatum]